MSATPGFGELAVDAERPGFPAARAIDLPEVIYKAQLEHLHQGRVVTVDETPIKAGCSALGKLRSAYFWPVYELGTKHIGVIQNLIVICRLQGISPVVYLTDDLQRMSQHPARDVIDLRP